MLSEETEMNGMLKVSDVPGLEDLEFDDATVEEVTDLLLEQVKVLLAAAVDADRDLLRALESSTPEQRDAVLRAAAAVGAREVAISPECVREVAEMVLEEVEDHLSLPATGLTKTQRGWRDRLGRLRDGGIEPDTIREINGYAHPGARLNDTVLEVLLFDRSAAA